MPPIAELADWQTRQRHCKRCFCHSESSLACDLPQAKMEEFMSHGCIQRCTCCQAKSKQTDSLDVCILVQASPTSSAEIRPSATPLQCCIVDGTNVPKARAPGFVIPIPCGEYKRNLPQLSQHLEAPRAVESDVMVFCLLLSSFLGERHTLATQNPARNPKRLSSMSHPAKSQIKFQEMKLPGCPKMFCSFFLSDHSF